MWPISFHFFIYNMDLGDFVLWFSGFDSAFPMQGGPGFIPGQGTRSHMLQLRTSTAEVENASQQETRFCPWVGKIPWGRAWPPTPVFLPGESHGQGSLAATVYGVTELDMTERLEHTHSEPGRPPASVRVRKSERWMPHTLSSVWLSSMHEISPRS